MALEGYPKTATSPNVITHSGTGAMAKITGVYDMVKMTSDDTTATAVLKTGVISDGSTVTPVVKMHSGDVIEGPFTTVEVVSASDADSVIWIWERSSLTTD
tara:strand:+ start:917 stop:1219 length:303 start_codon:yes stop_codon:yes gene_type:complete